jgi:hypothetical protein
MPGLQAPQPRQPMAAEMQNWYTGRNNARNQYMQQQATSTYNRGQADIARGQNLRNLSYNQGLQRRTFDDPYIGRGIFNSGIRRQGLQDFRTQGEMARGDIDQGYASTMGGYNLQDLQARDAYDSYMRNSKLQENARRYDLASEIRGII